jgi:cysteine desulfurase/selenocysteine lyase
MYTLEARPVATAKEINQEEAAMLKIREIRKDFPILERVVNGKQLVYLDNAATSQKPQQVIDSLTDYYSNYNANVHRGIHTMSEEATEAFESVRSLVKNFIGAKDICEIIYTRGTTESINLVATSWGKTNILPGDEIVLSPMEHHSNLVPWQVLAQERKAKLVFLALSDDGQIDMEAAQVLITEKTKLLAITHMSNVLGTINPVAKLSRLAHAKGAVVLVDGAQSVPHLATNVEELECDFLAFSFHKMLGPTGVGILWGKKDLLKAMPPYQYGGDMISSVQRESSRYNELPWKFEAGTPNIADVIAAGQAILYLNKLGMNQVREHEVALTTYALEQMSKIEGIKIYGPLAPDKRGGVISFNIAGLHPHDLGQILNESGIAIRAGHHCCQPLMKDLGVMGTARASFYVYNTEKEIDSLTKALKEADKVLGNVALR